METAIEIENVDAGNELTNNELQNGEETILKQRWKPI